MIVRKIREDEYRRTREIFAIAFEAGMRPDDVSAEEIERIRRAPANREERYWLERWAAFNDQGSMMGFLIGFPAPIRFDGQEALCTCIGGVSCLPQYRRQGVIAGCFRQHLADSYDQGAVFSYLYPFSTAFYRQFGYELCAETVEWRFDMSAIPAYPDVQGTAILTESHSQDEALREVYAYSMQGYNLSFLREDCDWSRIVSQQPAADNHFTYVWQNVSGTPKGFVCFRKEYDERRKQAIMVCSDIHFVDEEGLKGLMNFIRSFRSHYQRVHLPLPKDMHLERILPEVSGHCERTLRFTGMGRIINIRRALALARYQGNGSACFSVTDPLLPQNNDVFRVTFENGRCTHISHGGTPDTVMDIATFSRLLLGNLDAAEYAGTSLAQIFYPKQMFICDFF